MNLAGPRRVSRFGSVKRAFSLNSLNIIQDTIVRGEGGNY
jgi:hypothetical protein